LTITKGCHHFDLLSWLLGDRPEQVFAFGARNYYGADSPHNPSRVDGRAYTVAEQQPAAHTPLGHRPMHPDPDASGGTNRPAAVHRACPQIGLSIYDQVPSRIHSAVIVPRGERSYR
jgi:hypothetical protein